MRPAPAAFQHTYLPGEDPESGPTLVLLHGTGGNEHDLLEVGAVLAPGANRLGIRGRVLESGMPRFFRRLAEGLFDEVDLKVQTNELTEFVTEASVAYGFAPARVTAVGYSNGANIAASVLLSSPSVFPRAALFHAMLPFDPGAAPDLTGHRIFLAASKLDPMAPRESVERLLRLLKSGGASVTEWWSPSGHSLTGAEIEAAAAWFAG